MNYLITGGCGFIGSHVVDKFVDEGHSVFVVDKITYASRPDELNPKAFLYKIDISDDAILKILIEKKIDCVVNLAAETHVDNSIENPKVFIETNVLNTFKFVENCKKYQLNYNNNFKFIHISTDEVFGDLALDEKPFNEDSQYNPSSPYSSSKASGDMIINSYKRTYGFNSIILHCSNNYGSRQYNEKLIPKTISKFLNKSKIGVYGDGNNVREWTFVKDFANIIYIIASKESLNFDRYCIGSEVELSVIEVVNKIAHIMSQKVGYNCADLIEFTVDRKGHDLRYAIDSSRVQNEFNFNVDKSAFDKNLSYTIDYYLSKQS